MSEKERREHKRFKVLSGILSVNSKFGQVVDISVGGISFRYIDKEQLKTITNERGLLFGDDDLCLDNIPLTTVSDEIIRGGLSTEATTVRRRSMRFGTLTRKQKHMLEYYIWVNTAGDPPINPSS